MAKKWGPKGSCLFLCPLASHSGFCSSGSDLGPLSLFLLLPFSLGALLGPAPTGTGTIAFNPTFGNSTLIKTSFTLGELGFLVKVFRLLRLEGIFWVFELWTQ